MRRLELECKVESMSTLYEAKTITWHNAEFTFNQDLSANLKIWEDNIEPEQIAKTWKELEIRGEAFQVALKYLGNHLVNIKKKDYVTYYYNDKVYAPRNESEVEVYIKYIRGEIKSYCLINATVPMHIVSMSMTGSPAPLPQQMPFVPVVLQSIAETLVVADKVVNYPDLIRIESS